VRNMRLKTQILEYVEDKEKVQLRELVSWLDENKGRKTYGMRKVAGNLTALGWKQQRRGEDIYLKLKKGDE